MSETKPPVVPNVRVSAHDDGPPAFVSFEDRDNFVRDMVTIAATGEQVPLSVDAAARRSAPIPLSGKAAGPPVLALDEIKQHLRIETDVTVEDVYLLTLEAAARIQVSNDTRRVIDATVGENVKLAMLLAIAHWYRNREAVGSDSLAELPLAYKALLFAERDFPPNVY